MTLPSYFLKRPEIDDSPEVISSFERLFTEQVADVNGSNIDYSLSTPKWQFLNYLCDTQDVVVHGSGDPAIADFEPRQSNDVVEFGDQRAVYAASDGIWASFYAILDRDRYVRSLNNACVKAIVAEGEIESFYYFSINDDALPHEPWRIGTVYVLPKATFQGEPTKSGRNSAQWRSAVAVKPLAKISIGPEDFPFLDQIRGHDMETVVRRSEENPNGFPWLDD